MSTDLRDLLDQTVDARAPGDLAQRALTGARRRRARRLAVTGSVATVAAVVLGFVLVAQPFDRLDTAPLPSDVASLPAELPGPQGLPALADVTMATASAGYVVDGVLVLVDAATGQAATWEGLPGGSMADVGVEGGPLRPAEVAVSPDGRTALVALQFAVSTRLLGIPVALLDIGSAEARLVDGLRMSDAFVDSGWRQPTLMAWAPDATSAVCICIDDGEVSPTLWRVDVTGEAPSAVPYPVEVAPVQVAWGTAGVAVQLDPMGGPWTLLDGSIEGGPGLPEADGLALGHGDEPSFLAVAVGRFRAGVAGEDWSDEPTIAASGSLPGGPLAAVGPAGEDFYAVTWPTAAAGGEPPPPQPLDVWLVGLDGQTRALTQLPAGTTSASFAAF